MAARDKRTVANRNETLQIRSQNSVANSMERAAELAAAKAALASALAQIEVLQGIEKEE